MQHELADGIGRIQQLVRAADLGHGSPVVRTTRTVHLAYARLECRQLDQFQRLNATGSADDNGSHRD